VRLANHGLRPDGAQIVAIERDVERAARDGDAFFLFDQPGDAFGELDAAPLDADQQEIVAGAFRS